MRLLGIDYGTKRIGIAISDDLGMLAHEYGVLIDQSDENVIEALRQIILLEGIERIVLGLPLHMSGEEGEKTQEARDFGAMIENCLDIEVVFEDERWTTKLVDKTLREMKISQKQARDRKDMLAAKYILQSFMDRERNTE
ncbi:MAG TPA: Holliday junction resolvase RuvX [Patescibacteria group bacterium]|nr:Holliday junction resolvase RuvX [Patescibacteria group bacterium]